MSRRIAGAGAAAALAAAALPAVAADAGARAAHAPRVHVLVALRTGAAVQRTVVARAVTVRVGRRRCAVAAGTPLAALERAGAGRVTVRDFGSCSRRAADATGLYVSAVRGERAGGPRGWVYKVGNRVPGIGAGDPAARVRSGARLTWFFCRLSARTHGCQRTLALVARPRGRGVLAVTVRGYDDRGRGVPISGATVHAGRATARTDRSGAATLVLSPGRAAVYATAPGAVRSFTEAVHVT